MSNVRKLTTIAVAVAALGGLAAFNALFSQDKVDASRVEASAEREEALKLAQAETAEPAEDTPAAPAADKSDWPTTAPDKFKLKFECSNGDFVLEIHKDWAPRGVERFYEICRDGVYDEARFFRVVPGFVVQWGIPADPNVAAQWREATIQDDPVVQTNAPGTISFATSGKNSRTTQVFINYGDNRQLDDMGFAPFGKVVEGMEVVKAINAKHREKPQQGLIQAQGNKYLKAAFPDLDYIKSVRLVKEEGPAESPAEPAATPDAQG